MAPQPQSHSPRAHRAYRRGRGHLQAGLPDQALASFRLATRVAPGLGPAWLGAALAQLQRGEYLEAACALRRCLELGVEDPQIPPLLAFCLERLAVTPELAPLLAVEVVDLLQRDGVQRTSLARLTGDLLVHRHGLRPEVPIDELAADPLFVEGLSRTLVTRPALERWVGGLRQALLARALEQGQLDPPARVVASTIALCSFQCEFLLDVSPAENRCLETVRALMDGLEVEPASAPVWSDLVLLRACYEPMAEWEQAPTLASLPGECLGAPLARVVAETCRVVLEEGRIARELRSLTEVRDEVSRQVRDQYEVHPYPRWLTLKRTSPRPYAARATLRGAALPWHDVAGAHILVAGCGTGRHALEVAQSHPRARVFAVDLSRRSLAYGQRMAETLEVDNVVFAHADLLELPGTHLSFDVIECVGVLHHLREPLEGLEALVRVLAPGGLLRLDLYSRRAREDLRSGQQWVAEHGMTGTLEELRALRRALLAGELGPRSSLALHSLDFYSAAGVRDLFFHVQEHQYTLSGAAELASGAGLEVLGIDDDRWELHQHWRAVFGGRSIDWTDLDSWQRVEEFIPTAFLRMYPLWLRKPEI